MLRSEALYMNGQFESVLENILSIQSELPDQVLYLQPYGSGAMTLLKDNPPTVENPMRLCSSLTTDMANVYFEGEIVGWDDKRAIPPARHQALERILNSLQPNQDGLYDAAKGGDGKSVNLIHIRRLRRVSTPYPVTELIKINGGEPVAVRTQPGGFSYVKLKED